MADVFEEVEEQLRSDRYRTFFKKSWPYFAGALVLALAVALALWAYDAQRTAAAGRASEAYNQGLEAVGRGDKAAAEKEFAQVAKSGPPGYKSLALMQQAALRVSDRKIPEAVALFDQAAKAAPSPLIADSAQLKAALLLLDTAALGDIEKRLKPLTEEKRPYRPLAREALAMAKLRAGKIAEAKADLGALDLSLDTPEDVRIRAQALSALIQAGTAGAVADVAKTAAALPPAPPMPALPPGMVPPPPGEGGQSAAGGPPQSGAPQ